MFTVGSAGISNNTRCKSKTRRCHRRRRKMNNTKWLNGGILPGLSHCNWFWQSYQKATEWQGRHYLAYWRAKCLALEEENKYLWNHILETSTATQKSTQANSFKNTAKKKPKKKSKAKSCVPMKLSSENEHLQKTKYSKLGLEVSEEMLDFFEQSMKHKLERSKGEIDSELKKIVNDVAHKLNASEEQRKAVTGVKSKEDEEMDIKPPEKQIGRQRIEEMRLLYGQAAPMIIGMETALQLTFDRNVDKLQPPFWPNIPLKL